MLNGNANPRSWLQPGADNLGLFSVLLNFENHNFCPVWISKRNPLIVTENPFWNWISNFEILEFGFNLKSMKTSKSNTVYRRGDRRTTLYLLWTKLPNRGKEHFYRTYHRTLLRNLTFDSILESLISFKIKKISESMIVSLNENLSSLLRNELAILNLHFGTKYDFTGRLTHVWL